MESTLSVELASRYGVSHLRKGRGPRQTVCAQCGLAGHKGVMLPPDGRETWYCEEHLPPGLRRWQRGNLVWHIRRPDNDAYVLCGTSVSGPTAEKPHGQVCARCLVVLDEKQAKLTPWLNLFRSFDEIGPLDDDRRPMLHYTVVWDNGKRRDVWIEDDPALDDTEHDALVMADAAERFPNSTPTGVLRHFGQPVPL